MRRTSLRRRLPLLVVESDPWRKRSLLAFLEAEGFDATDDEGRTPPPEIVLLNLVDEKGPVAPRIERLRQLGPETKVLAFAREVNARTAFPCLLAGGKGVLPFDARPEEVTLAIQCVLDGSLWTPRPVLSAWVERVVTLGFGKANAFTVSEQRVLSGLKDELANKEIARRLGITEATVKFHVGKLLKKTGSKDRRELARFATETLPAEAL